MAVSTWPLTSKVMLSLFSGPQLKVTVSPSMPVSRGAGTSSSGSTVGGGALTVYTHVHLIKYSTVC